MNRIERRRARKRDGNSRTLSGSAGNADRADISALFASALEHFQSGQAALASDLARGVLSRDPNHAQALNLLGVIAQQAGRNRAAVKLLSEALTLDPDDPVFHYNIGLAFQGQGNTDEALAHYSRAISCGLQDETSLVRDNAFLSRCMQRIEAAWPRRLTLQELFGDDGIEAFVADNLLLHSLLRTGYAHDNVLERFLTELRFAILREFAPMAARTLSLSDQVLDFLCAMAEQCFNNGYVFAVGADELERVSTLKDKLAENLAAGADIDPLMLIVIASYVPLHSLSAADAIADRSYPEFIDALVSQQLRAPREEEEIRQSIQSITPIDDDVSLQVRQQYEESPYPAWVNIPPLSPATLDRYLSKKGLPEDLTRIASVRVKDILIAGCGTGRHSLIIAHAFPEADVLAVDISRTSLGYAMRKTREIGVRNIDYAHADILKLGSIDRAFDLIESIGVLHHLSDPAAGWTTLLSLLRPGGVIGVGLYSERARRAIVAARAFIAERGYRPTIEDIRACRQDMIRSARSALSQSVIVIRDFFDASGCRDMLFNVVEHRFTVQQIKSFLAENEMTFLGFEAPPRVRARFLEQFPGEESLLDLDKWDAFEAARPETFIGMYVFYAQKAG